MEIYQAVGQNIHRIRKAQQLGFELGGIVRQKQRFLHLVACGGDHPFR